MPERRPTNNTYKTTIITSVLALIILLLGISYWWTNIYTDSNNVFWGMINTNLTTNSVTRHVVLNQNGRDVDQLIRLQFGAQDASESRVTLKQKDSNGTSVIKSETIGTPNNDFSRYIFISTSQKSQAGKPLDTSKVIGYWGKSTDPPAGKNPAVQYYPQSILTIIPYGNFNQKQRQEMVNQMHTQNVYDLSGGSVKSDKQNGRAVYVYQLKVNPSAYVQLMQTYTKLLGLGDIGLDPANYAGSPPLSTEITVDKLSRQITKISYSASGQSETIVDQNIFQPVKLPTQTIPIVELQKRIQNLSQ